PEVGPELDQLVRWCTQREPDLRPHDAREALEFLRSIRGGAPLTSTRVLPVTGVIGTATPATTVLSGADRQTLAADAGTSAAAQALAPAAPATAVEHAEDAASRRARRGRWIAALLTVLLALAGGAGWWIGQGPGSQVTVPKLVGKDPKAASAELAELSLKTKQTKCSSLDVGKGLVESTAPKAGTRVDRDTRVTLCVSTGPEMLHVPTLNGLTLEDAKAEIEKAGFVFGEVTEQRFRDEKRDTVILATGSNGEGLGGTYPERGVIDVILSAGPVPDVAGKSADEATSILTEAGLKVDPDRQAKEYSADVPKGDVIRLSISSKTPRIGTKVGLVISRGPQLFAVPDVSGMDLQKAMDLLKDAGFTPVTAVPEAFRDFAKATGTDPAAGSKVAKGTEI
ncbi:MAG: PASTA domain-containing protein, partial [Actinobacteria bacterium]|nr:PASTA domain-containing protein [Actinomycetota bacterium]